MKPLPEIIKEFNWIDIFFLILLLRIVYIGFKNGLKFEFFKLLGTITALFLSLHYFSSLGGFINERVFNKHTPNYNLDVLAFAFLLCAGYTVFFILRLLVSRLMDSQINPVLDKWGGVTVGAFRAVLLSSVLLCMLLASHSGYFKKSIRSSFSGSYVVRVAPAAYRMLWHSVISKLNSGEKLNDSVNDLTKL